jgi:hypothetical protein
LLKKTKNTTLAFLVDIKKIFVYQYFLESINGLYITLPIYHDFKKSIKKYKNEKTYIV